MVQPTDTARLGHGSGGSVETCMGTNVHKMLHYWQQKRDEATTGSVDIQYEICHTAMQRKVVASLLRHFTVK